MRRSGLGSRALSGLAIAMLLLMGQSPSASAATQYPPWVTHQDPLGYMVQSPPGWSARPSREQGWIHLAGPEGESVVIWPVFIPAALDFPSAMSVHRALATSGPLRVEWTPPRPVAPSATWASTAAQGMAGVSVFAWVPSPKGSAGYFYLTSARGSEYRRKQGDFARILESVRLVGAPPGSRAPGLRYVQYRDPNEGAFSTEVPADWKTAGGLFRFNALDYRPAIETTSPDGRIRIMRGDPEIPKFIEPFSPRFPEGSWYAPYGFYQFVRRFVPAAHFCQEYVLSKAPKVCSNVEIAEVRDRPDKIAQYLTMDPSLRSSTLTIGEARFRCTEQGEPKVGYCGAATWVGGGSRRMWRVDRLIGYMAPPQGAALAEEIMQHIGETWQWNPQWAMMQLRNEGATSEIVSATANQIADEAARRQRARDAVGDEMARRRSQATLGIVDAVDPHTGRRTSVESGSNYYWVDQRGAIVGTNTDTRPSIDFRALVQLP
jgi:hypothetical protein